jgi:hypothetical protein
MSNQTLEKLLENVRTLPPEERAALKDWLDANPPIKPHKTLAQIAKEQGKKPLKFAELRKLGEFFPAEESVDELVHSIYEQRNKPGSRHLV